MELKEFIAETIKSIADATSELQKEYEDQGVIINPPVSSHAPDLYEVDSASHTFRKIESVEFDVAVSAASEASGGGKAGLKILSVEAGAHGEKNKRNETVSRVRFSIPIALRPSNAESDNRERLNEKRTKPNAQSVKGLW